MSKLHNAQKFALILLMLQGLSIGAMAQETLSITNNPYRYSGYYFDSESWMNYCKSRYYSPELMTFVTRDTWTVPNRYNYCGNDSIMFTDENGHMMRRGNEGKDIQMNTMRHGQDVRPESPQHTDESLGGDWVNVGHAEGSLTAPPACAAAASPPSGVHEGFAAPPSSANGAAPRPIEWGSLTNVTAELIAGKCISLVPRNEKKPFIIKQLREIVDIDGFGSCRKGNITGSFEIPQHWIYRDPEKDPIRQLNLRGGTPAEMADLVNTLLGKGLRMLETDGSGFSVTDPDRYESGDSASDNSGSDFESGSENERESESDGD